MLLYYITDRSQFSGDDVSRQKQLLMKIAEASACEVDYIQLREKDLHARDLEALARHALAAITNRSPTKLLINSRADVALAAGADGVHLRSNDVSPQDVLDSWAKAASTAESAPRSPLIAVSCHSSAEVAQAAAHHASFAVFGPVFEKPEHTATGLAALREASRHGIPLLALGGVTLDNARACVDSGAAGIAAVRLFQQNPVAEIVRKLRG